MPEGPPRKLAVFTAASGVTLLLAAAAGAQTLGYTGALYAVRGTYPTETVNSVYFFNTVDMSAGPVRVAATVPLIRIDGTPAGSLDGSVPVAARTVSGFGDPLVRVDVRVLEDRAGGFQVSTAAAVKLAIVDSATGRGTGVADYGFGGSVFKVVDRLSLMADALFWKYGDPDGYEFSDTLSYSFGAARVVGAAGRWSALASMSGFSSGSGGAAPPLAINVGVLRVANRGRSVGVSASIGLNDSSSDFSIGTSWRFAR